MLRVFSVILLALLMLAAIVASQWRHERLRVSGFVEADEIRLGSRVGGRVAAVHVREGEAVAQGQLLVTLEPFDILQREAEAVAQLAARYAELARLENGFRSEDKGQAESRLKLLQAKYEQLEEGPRTQEIAAADARLKVALAQLELAQQTYDRTKGAFERGGANSAELERAVEGLKSAQNLKLERDLALDLLKEGTRQKELEQAAAQVEEAKQALELLRNGYRREDIEQARATRDATRAALEALRAQKAELIIHAPVAGVIEALELRPGDLVPANAPVLSLMDTSRLWIRAYVPENRVALQGGESLSVTLDSFPAEEFTGKVTYISRQAEFTPGNVQTPDERSKQVFRVKVELEGVSAKLRPGMSANVWLEPPVAN